MVTAAGQRAADHGAARRGARALILAFGVGPVTALGGGCSQAPAPATPAEAPESAAVSESAAAPEPASEPLAEDPATGSEEAQAGEPAPEAAEPDATLIVIERRDRAREEKPRTLYEASVAAREQRANAGPSTVSITDENLHEFQGKGLTFAEDPEGEEEAGGEAPEGEGDGAATDSTDRPAAEAVRGESYWRSRVRDLRLALREAVDELGELDERAASLRRSFYAEDDPYVRDAEIKPAWDRTLDRIAGTRRALFGLREELAETLEEGRRAGALPGWLREGIELEPRPEELPAPREGSHEPGEPSVIEIGEPPP